MYTWISGVHYSFLRRQGDSLQSSSGISADLMFKALIWPVMHIENGYDSTIQDVVD